MSCEVIIINDPPTEIIEVSDGEVIELPVLVEIIELEGSTTIEITENPTNLEVIEPDYMEVTTQGTIGPEGPQGKPIEEVMLANSEEKDIVNDSPSTDDLTVYYGVAQGPNADKATAVWLITRTIFTAADDFDSSKRHAGGSAAYDQIWDDHLTLGYG